MTSRATQRSLFLYPFLLTVLLYVLAGCVTSRKPRAAPPAPLTARSDYAGSQACAGCHAEESSGFGQTNHALTLHPMTRSALGPKAPPAGPLPGTGCVLEAAGDGYVVRVPSTGEQEILDYALGSGKTGMTYISIENKTTLIEMRRSYFPRLGRWLVTPGQEGQEKDPNHIGHDDGNERICIQCHAVTIPADSLRTDPKFMGVGCEACHGPGAAHVASLSVGKLDSSMEKLNGANGERINMLCGRCHRTVEDVLAKPVFDQKTDRFPVYGLASSRCFQASGAQLTCITCHDPHRNARTDPHYYVAICISCHSSSHSNPTVPASSGSAKETPAVRGRVCPVNPRSGCIECHMPRHRVFTDTSIPTAMADHRIRVHKQ